MLSRQPKSPDLTLSAKKELSATVNADLAPVSAATAVTPVKAAADSASGVCVSGDEYPVTAQRGLCLASTDTSNQNDTVATLVTTEHLGTTESNLEEKRRQKQRHDHDYEQEGDYGWVMVMLLALLSVLGIKVTFGSSVQKMAIAATMLSYIPMVTAMAGAEQRPGVRATQLATAVFLYAVTSVASVGTKGRHTRLAEAKSSKDGNERQEDWEDAAEIEP